MRRNRVSSEGQARSGWLALAFAIGLAGAASAQDAEPVETEASAPADPSPGKAAERTPELKRARVVQEPTTAEIRDLYPEAALRKAMNGKAAAVCEIALDRRLVNCVVTEEDPPGYGFGAAVVKVAQLYRVAPPTFGGEVVPHAKFKIPMRFEMELPSLEQQAADARAAAAARGEAPPEETPAQRLKRLGPLRRSEGVLWAPIGFAVLVALGLAWGLWPVRRGRRVHRPADQRA
jgi:hypothetical protein